MTNNLRTEAYRFKFKIILSELLAFILVKEEKIPPIIETAEAQEIVPIPVSVEAPETLEAMVSRIAEEHGIATTTLHNVVHSESRYNPLADNGEDRGLVQINRKAWPDVTEEQAFNLDFALNFAADKISKGEEWYWTSCNCVSAVKLKTKLPKMAEIIPNTELAVGTVVIMQYGKVKHVAYVESISEKTFTVFESNYKPCLLERREVRINDPAIVGYWSKT